MKDEQGRPFIVVREYVNNHDVYWSEVDEGISVEGHWADKLLCSQGKKKRQHGNDAVKSHITAARTVANIVRTSLVWRKACETWR